MDANTVGLIIVAVIQLLTLVLGVYTRDDVHKIKLATNSIHDATVALTAKVSMAEGIVQGRGEMKNEIEKGIPNV